MSHLSRAPRGQQRDKPYREALRMELAAAGEDMKKLREIAKVHIARCEAGDMQAIKELANRLDGWPLDQAKSAYEQAVNGYTREEREIAVANVGKALADIKAVQSTIDQMVVYAPVASQVYQRNVDPGEYVSPGVPLVTLIDLNDIWIHFDLREDLVKTLKLSDRFGVRIPALSDRRITVEVRLIATKGEYASWRATRATGDFDLRTFEIRAYPVEKVPELRPGMGAYMDWTTRQ